MYWLYDLGEGEAGGEAMNGLISILSEIRSQYNCFNPNDEPYYHALSEAIALASTQKMQLSDLISREDAINAFKKELTIGESKGNYVTICSAVGYEGAKQILERLPSVQPEITKRTAETEQNIPNGELISRKAAIDAVHKTIFKFFDIVEDDSESPITYQDERLLELNKSITQQIKALPSAQSEWEELLVICDVCGHAIRVKRHQGDSDG